MQKHWIIKVCDEAKAEFSKLPVATRTRIREKLRREKVKEFPNTEGCSYKAAPGWYSIRVGNYRIVFAPSSDGSSLIIYGTLNIFAVLGRKNLCKKLRERYLRHRWQI